MSNQILIKICGIKTPEIALAAAKMGADFIGLVFCPSSRRFISLPEAKIISEAAAGADVKVVGVFARHDVREIIKICEFTGIKTAQLHGAAAKHYAYKLPQDIQRIYVVNVRDDGKILDAEDKKNIGYLDPARDYLLFDSLEAGSGRGFDFSHFKSVYGLTFFLAGGLNADNVKGALDVVKPDGVDVSSGVENIDGVKDANLIKQFILQTRQAEKRND